MRNSILMARRIASGGFLRVAWTAASLAVPAAFYFAFLQPRLAAIHELDDAIRLGGSPAWMGWHLLFALSSVALAALVAIPTAVLSVHLVLAPEHGYLRSLASIIYGRVCLSRRQ